MLSVADAVCATLCPSPKFFHLMVSPTSIVALAGSNLRLPVASTVTVLPATTAAVGGFAAPDVVGEGSASRDSFHTQALVLSRHAVQPSMSEQKVNAVGFLVGALVFEEVGEIVTGLLEGCLVVGRRVGERVTGAALGDRVLTVGDWVGAAVKTLMITSYAIMLIPGGFKPCTSSLLLFVVPSPTSLVRLEFNEM
jgi:hypothetical protein